MRNGVVFSTLSVSPHQTAVFGELAKLVPVSYLYHFNGHDAQRAQCGWKMESMLPTRLIETQPDEELENAPILIEGMRDVELIERRLRRGLPTVYLSERWFKPVDVRLFGRVVQIPGIFRLAIPRYLKMARALARCMKDPNFHYLAQGIWAARDMARICGIFSGRVSSLWRCPALTYEHVPCGRIGSSDPKAFGTDRIRLWGYFVEPTTAGKAEERGPRRDHTVLWVGRMLGLKRVDTLIRAARLLPAMQFTLVGEGPEEARLKSLAAGLDNVMFMKYQKAERVRELMRQHDVFVLTSDGMEGWGAVVNEALEEGMCVYGTREAGASASMLPDDCLFAAGDVDGLKRLLEKPVRPGSIGKWVASSAAAALHGFLEQEVAHAVCR